MADVTDAKRGGGDDMDTDPPISPKAVPDKHTEQRFLYNMNHPNRGIAIIFNNKTFTSGHRERNGTDLDAAAMNMRLKSLGFEVQLHNNQTVSEMLNITERVAAQDHSKNDAFVMVILSHGDEKGVYGIDTVVSVENFVNPFKGDKCASLAGKPKLFFIQACRGDKFDRGVKIESDASVEKKQIIPTDADIMIAYSVVPGYFSWRNTTKGSWFIRALSQVLEDYGDTREILWMMTRVNGLVAFTFESHTHDAATDGKKQVPAVTSMLTKELYFPPKQ